MKLKIIKDTLSAAILFLVGVGTCIASGKAAHYALLSDKSAPFEARLHAAEEIIKDATPADIDFLLRNSDLKDPNYDLSHQGSLTDITEPYAFANLVFPIFHILPEAGPMAVKPMLHYLFDDQEISLKNKTHAFFVVRGLEFQGHDAASEVAAYKKELKTRGANEAILTQIGSIEYVAQEIKREYQKGMIAKEHDAWILKYVVDGKPDYRRFLVDPLKMQFQHARVNSLRVGASDESIINRVANSKSDPILKEEESLASEYTSVPTSTDTPLPSYPRGVWSVGLVALIIFGIILFKKYRANGRKRF